LLFKYRILFLLEELIQISYTILVGLLFRLDASQLISQIFNLNLTSFFEVLYFPFQAANLRIILDQLFFISLFTVTQTLETSLFGLVQVIVKHDNGFVFAN